MKEAKVAFLVDDDRDDQEIFQLALRDIDPTIRCEFAYDGEIALKRLSQKSGKLPDFIFIDINMPRMNGVELLRELKKIERLNSVPIYMLSTAIHPRISEQCLALGANGALQKAGDINEIKSMLSAIVEERYAKRL